MAEPEQTDPEPTDPEPESAEDDPATSNGPDGDHDDARDARDGDRDDAHLRDVDPGAGCTEIWEHLSETRDD